MKYHSIFTWREVPSSLALLFLVLSLTSCSESQSVTCSPQLSCPKGWACSADGKSCIQTLCGDGEVQEGEACDDGDTISGDGCNSTCTSNETCGNGFVDESEQCDDKNDSNEDDCLNTCILAKCGDGFVNAQGVETEACDYRNGSNPCNHDCTVPRCGDGLVTSSTGESCDSGNQEDTATCDGDCTIPTCGDGRTNKSAGEDCDDGNKNDNDDCLSTCKKNECGDGHVNSQGPENKEECDDGNITTETQCPYGVQFCNNFCNEKCEKLALTGPYCGDSRVTDGEKCDDGNTRDETYCPHLTLGCETCNANCTETLKLEGAYCGNGVREFWEYCDDGNNKPCGSCNATCTSRTTPPKATGRITAIAPGKIVDGETFSLSDGLDEHQRQVFEFDRNGSTENENVAVIITTAQNESKVAQAIAKAINDLSADELAISAEVKGAKVILTHEETGNFSEQPIEEFVLDPGFSVRGMLSDGGAGYCSEGTGCIRSEDCTFGLTCIENLCTEL